MDTSQKEFLLKEYDKLNNEVAKLLEETRTREKYSLATIAIIATWIYTEIIRPSNDIKISNKDLVSIVRLLSWIPLVVTFLYGISVLLIYKNIKWIGEYLSKVEVTFINGLEYGKKEAFGWEKYFSEKNRKSFFVIWTWIFWGVQIIIAMTIIFKSYSITS